MAEERKPLIHVQDSSASFSNRDAREYGINDDGKPEKTKVLVMIYFCVFYVILNILSVV